MSGFIASKVLRLMRLKDIKIEDSNILILGITFKENCPDIRNTKIIDVYNELIACGANVDIYDPVADVAEVKNELQINLVTDYSKNEYSAIILAVAHTEFKSIDFKKMKNNQTVIFDVKSFLPSNLIDGRL